MCHATEESVANPELQILLRCQLAALHPQLFNMYNASSTDFDPTVHLINVELFENSFEPLKPVMSMKVRGPY